MPDASAFAVNPTEAIAFLRDKVRIPTEAWTDLWQAMHSRAFVVAGAQSDRLLADFHEAVTKAIADGTTLEDFRKDFDKIVADNGWSYNGSRNWRSRVIFDTNLRTAYAAGRWSQIQRTKAARPYLRYVHVEEQPHPRWQHHLWHNTVLPVDDPWWLTHFAPNGWGCKCTVQSLSERDLKRYGLTVSPHAPASPLVDRVINTASGKVTVKVPQGIDPGFAYNPGVGAFGRGSELLALERHGTWAPLNAPGAPEPDLSPLPVDVSDAGPMPSVAPGDEAALRAALAEALGGDELIETDPLDVRVRLSQAIADHILEDPTRQDGRERYFGLMPSVVSDPAEIWIGWEINTESGRVRLRRRYLKLVDIGKGVVIGLVADADGGEWSGMTFFRGRSTGSTRLRSGRLVYRRGD